MSSIDNSNLCCRHHPDAALIEDYRAGDVICSSCGLVVGDRVIDVGSEWRSFSDDKQNDRSRVGGSENTLLNSSDLTTIIGPATGSASIDTNGQAKYKSRRNISASDQYLTSGFKEINSMADRISLPRTILDSASYHFKKVHDGKTMKGRKQNAIAAACLYLACRQEKVPRTFKEIAAISNITKKTIARYYEHIQQTLSVPVGSVSPTDYMARFCLNLALTSNVEKAATHIALKVSNLDVSSNHGPLAVTAAAIYMACQASKEKRTHKEIADISGVGRRTMSDCYKRMLLIAVQLFPKGFKFSTTIGNLPKF